MQRYTVYLYLETALNVSGGISTHHQECIQLYLQHLIFVTPLLLSAAIVEELEPVWVCSGWRNVATCWIYIGILLGAQHILHISRVRVKYYNIIGPPSYMRSVIMWRVPVIIFKRLPSPLRPLVYNSASFLAACCSSFLLHAVTNNIFLPIFHYGSRANWFQIRFTR